MQVVIHFHTGHGSLEKSWEFEILVVVWSENFIDSSGLIHSGIQYHCQLFLFFLLQALFLFSFIILMVSFIFCLPINKSNIQKDWIMKYHVPCSVFDAIHKVLIPLLQVVRSPFKNQNRGKTSQGFLRLIVCGNLSCTPKCQKVDPRSRCNKQEKDVISGAPVSSNPRWMTFSKATFCPMTFFFTQFSNQVSVYS